MICSDRFCMPMAHLDSLGSNLLIRYALVTSNRLSQNGAVHGRVEVRTSGPQWSPPKTTTLKEGISRVEEGKMSIEGDSLGSKGSFKKGGMRDAGEVDPAAPRSATQLRKHTHSNDLGLVYVCYAFPRLLWGSPTSYLQKTMSRKLQDVQYTLLFSSFRLSKATLLHSVQTHEGIY